MPAAFLPSPSRGLWHLGPIPIRAYAICVVLGIVVGLWVANRRYLRIGGRPGMILDVATVAVPTGLAGARLYSVLTEYELYFGHGHDWTYALRIWDGRLGVPGGVVFGAVGAWIVCRRERVYLAPVAGAVAPGLAFAQAIGRWGNWFSQERYGHPSGLPWAVEISPEHRLAGYLNFSTFQPMFLYESAWDALVGVLVIYAARRFLLTGDRTFAVYAGLYALGRFWTEGMQLSYSPHQFGLRVDQVLMVLVVIGAAAYLYLTRHRRGPDFIAPPDDTDTNAPVGAGTRTHESGPRIAIDDADDAVSDADDQSRVRGDALGIGAAAESAPS
jgi:phosphatidylglycerol---prolipoprotein diacylglyceryl transferase